MALKLSITSSFFSTTFDPNHNPRPSTDLRFSASTNCQTHSDSDPNAHRKFRYTGPPPGPYLRGKKPDNPSKLTTDPQFQPALKFSNIPKSKPKPVKTAPETVKISEDGLSYVIDGAPFEFKYSYTETPKAKPLKLREQPFVPFGPATMPRPWTGRAPLPPSKKKLKEFDSFVLPPPHKKGVKPVQSPGPFLPGTGPRYVQSREEVLGEPLTEEEVIELIRSCRKTSRQLNMGRDGFTHNMLDNIHAHWKRRRVCKIKCKGVCTVDMDNVCDQLEEKTGGKIIYRRGGVLYLFRGRNYNYKLRPRFPLMLWKPTPPVYPRLIDRVPEGLTREEAIKMRQKGRTLPPICKLGKNGVYDDLVNNVREAFEECELARINCQGLNRSDYRKIGAKLMNLVPCTLLSFENEHILMWRGPNWKSSLSNVGDNGKEANEIDIENKNDKTLPSEAQEFSAPSLQKNPVENVSNLSCDNGISLSSNDVTLGKVEVPCPAENSEQSVSVVTNSSLAKTYEIETTNDALDSYGEPEPCKSTHPSMTVLHYDSDRESPLKAMSDSHGTEDIMENKCCSDDLSASISGSDATLGSSDYHINGMVDIQADKLLDDSGEVDVSLQLRPAAPCMKEITLLLEQAIEKGSALVLDENCFDADNIYQTTVSFAKSAPPGPVFTMRRKVAAPKSDKQEESTLETKETAPVPVKGKGIRQKGSKIPKKQNFEHFLNVVPQGTLGVDELAKLLT